MIHSIYEKIYEFGAEWGIINPKECIHLKNCFTHKSFNKNSSNSFERLELLGDSILGAIITKELNKNFPSSYSEGDLSRARTNLVNKSTLSEVSRKLDFPNLILMGKSELNLGYNYHDKILADTYEAFIGAIFLNRNENFKACNHFIITTLNDNLKNIINTINSDSKIIKDFKSQLQEYTQSNLNCLPEYKVLNHIFENNRHKFFVEVFINNSKHGLGIASDRRSAEQSAANEALSKMKKET